MVLSNIYDEGNWYLANTDTIVTEISDGQTAVYRNSNENGTVEGFKYGDVVIQMEQLMCQME